MKSARNIYASSEGKKIAVVFQSDDQTLFLFDPLTWKLETSIECRWSIRDKRCSVGLDRIYAGDYRGGVAAYNIESGEERWLRADIRGVQSIQFSAPLGMLLCRAERETLYLLDANNGHTRKEIRNVSEMHANPSKGDIIVSTRTCIRVIECEDGEFELPSRSFASIDAVFHKRLAAISEVNAGIRLLDMEKRAEIFGRDPILECGQFVQLSASPQSDTWVGRNIESEVLFVRGDWSGNILSKVPTNSNDGAFALNGTIFVDLEGSVFNTADGSVSASRVFE